MIYSFAVARFVRIAGHVPADRHGVFTGGFNTGSAETEEDNAAYTVYIWYIYVRVLTPPSLGCLSLLG